jgi:hypothetical protein
MAPAIAGVTRFLRLVRIDPLSPGESYLHTFVADYNRTRLRSLDYHAPAELLAKLAGHNTCAGVTTERAGTEFLHTL